MSTTQDQGGYWLVASDGGVFNYGDAAFCGSGGSSGFNKSIVAAPDGRGYWLVASGAIKLNKPVVGTASMGGTCSGIVIGTIEMLGLGDLRYLGSCSP